MAWTRRPRPSARDGHARALQRRRLRAHRARALPAGAYGYFAGGADDERTLARQLRGWRRWPLRPRVLVDVSETSAATTVLRHRGLDAGAGRAGRDPAHGARRRGGRDGTRGRGGRDVMVVSSLATTSLADIAAAAPGRAALVPALPLPRSGSDAGADRPGRRRRLRRARADRRRSPAGPPRARPADRIRVPAEVTVPSFAAAGGRGRPAPPPTSSRSWTLRHLARPRGARLLHRAAGAGEGRDDRPRTPTSPASTAPPAWSCRTTAGASSTA